MKRFSTPLLFAGWIALAACFALGGCKSARFDRAAQDKVVQEATQMLHDYYDRTCSIGLIAEFEFLDSTDDFHWKPLGSERILGYDSIAAIIRRNMVAIDSSCATWKTLTVNPVALDTARYQGEMLSYTRMLSGETHQQRVQEAGVLIRRAGKWYLLSGETLNVKDI